jgi:UDP-N-acetylmuramoyl-L-alanyl-D-glutamate--2,6-diaminopimelate ligase
MNPEALVGAILHGDYPVAMEFVPAPGRQQPITNVTHDSRMVRPGSLFCCVRGARADGHQFAEQAVQAGAVALVVDHRLSLPIAQLVVNDVRAAMSTVGGAFHGYPGNDVTLVGITGTNGKTTTAALLGAVLSSAGLRTEIVGTLTQTRTTPEATDVQERLAEARRSGCTHVVMEVTSHALELHRVAALRFAVSVFTNLSQDHLDFHGTLEAYFRAKAKLFTPDLADCAVVNSDDPHGRMLLDAAQIPTTPVSISDAKNLVLTGTGSSFLWRDKPVQLQLAGEFNVHNALEAMTVASMLGVVDDDVIRGVSAVASVPGRFESVSAGQPFGVVVDYAHTPDGLERVLASARAAVANGQLIVVFGCGGDRDRGKRPIMGEIATRLADVAVLTSDNPRSEDPDAIIAEVCAGIQRTEVLRVEPDRRRAIQLALGLAVRGDVVVLAGKGHEVGQETAGVKVPFDDRLVAMEFLRGTL